MPSWCGGALRHSSDQRRYPGRARNTRQRLLSEHCLSASEVSCLTDGSKEKSVQGVTAFFFTSRYSRKPLEMRRMIERVRYGPYLELFARCRVSGRHVRGNKVKSDIELQKAA